MNVLVGILVLLGALVFTVALALTAIVAIYAPDDGTRWVMWLISGFGFLYLADTAGEIWRDR